MWKLFAALALLLTACETSSFQKRGKEQIVRLSIHTEPPTLDPRKANDTHSVNIIKMCFEGLLREGPDGKPELALADRVDRSKDGKTYTFHLKEARWSDGVKVTAKDFEETWKKMLNPLFPSERAYELYPIKNAKSVKEGKLSKEEIGIKALDEKTLSVELEHPGHNFLLTVTLHSYLPHPHHASRWAPNEKEYICNGPFKLKKWRHYNEIILEKNSTYWDADSVKLEEIHLPIIEDESTELALFEKKELDWAGYPLSQLPLDSLPTLVKENKIQVYPLAGVFYFIFNTKQFPFTNVKLRRALALALNRQAIIDNVMQGGQKPALGFVPATMWEKTINYFGDAATAEAQLLFQEALHELGLTKGTFPPLTLSYNTVSANHKIAQAVQQQWETAFGIRIRLENKEWKVFLDEVGRHQFQIARMGGVASINDPTDFLTDYRYDASERNYSQWYNPEFSKMLEKAEKSKSEQKRMEYLSLAEKILMDEMPIAPLYFYEGSYMKQPYLKGVYISGTGGIDLKHAYIEAAE